MFRILSKFFALMDYIWGLIKEGLNNPYKGIYQGDKSYITILANGPSLRYYLNEIENNHVVTEEDFFAINDLVNYPEVRKLKPKHYALSDPMFFWDTYMKERGMTAINNLKDLVDWPMNIYIPWKFRNKPYIRLLKHNQNIRVVPFHSVEYPLSVENERVRHFFFKRGLGNGEYSTVALNALYVSITLGYKNITLQGVDHTFFTGLCVNDDNIPCYMYEYASDAKATLKPMRYWYSEGREYKDMALFTYEMCRIFNGHKIMSIYAKYMGAIVINATKDSLIDVYPRKK